MSDLSHLIKAYDVRGTVPDQLNPEVARAIGAAFAHAVVLPEAPTGDAPARPRAVVGHDMRDSGPALVDAFAAGLTDAGVDLTRIGLCSTDGLYHASGVLGVPGAMFTASHNPAAYNGIKLCRAGARPVGQDSGLAEVRRLAEQFLDDGLPAATDSPGAVRDHDMLADYAAFLRALVDLSGIRPLKVVVDAGNGMGGHTVPAVLGTGAGLPALPLDVVPLYFELDGTFPNHEANPLDPENLRDLQAAVVEHDADLGLAFDGDADRCFVVDEHGDPVSPSAITALVGLREVGKELEKEGAGAPVVIHNLITSRAVPDFLDAAGARTVRTRVGHSFIKAQMAEHDAVFGGEHSAHYYFRDFFFADTGMLAAMHVLAALGTQPHPLSAVAEMYEPYVASGEINSTVADVPAARARVVEAYVTQQGAGPVEVDELDGLTVSHWASHPQWWFNLRASNTEPLLRLNVEAADQDIMEKVRDDVLSLVRGTSTPTEERA
ncbi:phosphomannomutase/phosphoglucomutase [Cellulosimicrobium sp. CUA-896]|uniref:phosphomannomutase/phosphoglucomutase n=1 Tax=Cellulosimicrobium sp. CUA-896 TaxID=1517881 RepID=UPI0009602587|nr:phosphomannomutase/phosphoglucomutase [Cellulosimicrobium sp. CUA-896]OLT55430.1 phosphomannomutase/phosphoglucomutase [Cellulosimicrobium sp. CUA-896]